MRKRLTLGLVAGGLLAAMLPGMALAGGGPDRGDYAGPNQGNPDMVFTIDNTYVDCEYPVPGRKVEGGNLGRYTTIYSYHPIDKVTVKSGRDAYEKWSYFGEKYGKYFVKFKLSKDISNYVVWTCPNGTPV